MCRILESMKEGANRKIAATLLPLIAIVIGIFFTYSNIAYFFVMLFAVLAAELFLLYPLVKSVKNIKNRLNFVLPFILIFAGSFGLIASTNLTREKIELLKNPDHIAACSLSPIVACSPIIASDQASAMGDLPNPVLGIFGFGAVLVAGMSLLAGGKFSRWWWRSLFTGIVFGFVFCAWLVWQSLYSIGALCLYCNAVWALVVPLFVYTALHGVQNNYLKLPKRIASFLEANHLGIVILIYLIVLAMVYFRFESYWLSLI